MVMMIMMIQETLAKEESENQKKALELRDLQVVPWDHYNCNAVPLNLKKLGFQMLGGTNLSAN